MKAMGDKQLDSKHNELSMQAVVGRLSYLACFSVQMPIAEKTVF